MEISYVYKLLDALLKKVENVGYHDVLPFEPSNILLKSVELHLRGAKID